MAVLEAWPSNKRVGLSGRDLGRSTSGSKSHGGVGGLAFSLGRGGGSTLDAMRESVSPDMYHGTLEVGL